MTNLSMLGQSAFLPGLIATMCLAQANDSKRPWPGYAVLGNGNLTAVYSDDARITAATHQQGIQHFYFKNYTADYVVSTSFSANGAPAVGMKNFFTTHSQTPTQTVLCFVHPDDAVVLSVTSNGSFDFKAVLRKEIKTDQIITLTSFQATDGIALAQWSNGTVIALASKSASDKVTLSEDSVRIAGAKSGEILLIPGDSSTEVLAKVARFRQKKDIEAEASTHWNAWMDGGKLPHSAAAYLEAYKRNLYCVKSATLNGQIPADITGQFVTNNMPQLYPRDAMMCARVLLLTGHPEEAKTIIEFWAKPNVPMKTPGEWYARYDAHAKAVDGGSGARFDEPEWDANGYYIYLLNEYHRAKGVWLADPKFIYKLADFLVAHISENGLLQEGGIVEWTGYLPATNMICSAALIKAAKIARDLGNETNAAAYVMAAKKIANSLPLMFDPTNQTYGDLRTVGIKKANGASIVGEKGDKLYLWDTTANVGVIWGYPNHKEIELSNAFYARNTVKLDGGMQYFDSPDPGLASYGHGVFFFTTAAAAQYESLRGKNAHAKRFIDWMVKNANSYGLMPEHIFPDGSECSAASPLSWCSAEFAAALLLWSQS